VLPWQSDCQPLATPGQLKSVVNRRLLIIKGLVVCMYPLDATLMG
jgi:hypothetical protein